MSKLSKRNRIGKYQTAWGPLGLNVGPILLSTGVSLPEVVGGASILPIATAASFPIGEIMNYKLHQNGGGVVTSPYSTTSVYTPELSDATYVTTPTLSEPRYYSPWDFDIHLGSSKARTDALPTTAEPTDTTTTVRRDPTTTTTPASPQGGKNGNDDNGKKSSKARKIVPWLIALAAASSYPARRYVWPLISSIWTGKYDTNQFVEDEDKKEEENNENDQNESIQENFNFGSLPQIYVAPEDSIRD